jgi:NhaP-type Na+/H+ or K+/H+ antiporter
MDFDTSIFFFVVLPPIIYSAGYTINTSYFFMNIGYISLYGFIGTFISVLVLS